MNESALITVNITYCTNNNDVTVADTALPYIQRWLKEHGYIHITEAHTAGVTTQLAAHRTPCTVPNTADGPC